MQIVLLLRLSQLVSEFLTKLYLLSCSTCHLCSQFFSRLFVAAACPSSSRVTYLACRTWFSWMFKRSTRISLDSSGFEFWSVEFYNFNLLVGSSHNNFQAECVHKDYTFVHSAYGRCQKSHPHIHYDYYYGLWRMANLKCVCSWHIRIFCMLPTMLLEIDVRKVELWHCEYWMNGKIQLMFRWLLWTTLPIPNFLLEFASKTINITKAFHNNVLVLGNPMQIEDSFMN